MLFTIKGKSAVRKVPQPVQDYIRKRFMLRTEFIGNLRCIEYSASLRGEPVTMIVLFSPEAARKLGVTIRGLADIEGHPEALLFEGYTNQVGQVYVADRRFPITSGVIARYNGKQETKRR